MDFELSDQQKIIRDTVRDVAEKYGADYWRQKDKKREYPTEFVQELAKGGWFGTVIPEEYGGAGLGLTEASIVLEELTLSGAGLGGSNSCHAVYFISHSLLKHGNEEQKKKYLPKMATGEIRFQALAITEQNSGFDTTKIKTSAEKKGDHYIINGTKVFISRVAESDLMLLVARTTPLEKASRRTKGLSLFVVDLNEAGDSIKRRRIDMGVRHAIDTNELYISDLKVPVENLIGQEGEGLYHLMDTLNPERVYIASECIGLGKLALKKAVQYSKERVVFDRPIGKNQAIQFPLAEGYAEIEVADLMRYKAAAMYDKGIPCAAEANIAKLTASKAAFSVANQAVQTFGGYGLSEDFDIERLFRDSRLMLIAPISTEMILNYIGEHVLGMPRSY